MKKIKFLLLINVIFLLISCTPPAEQVMPPLQYSQPINLHIAKNAYLNWEVGKQSSSYEPSHVSAQNGILGAVIGAAIESQQRKSNPGRYTYTYGKAQQAVFMTSFADVLEKNRVFNNVTLTTNPRDAKTQDVLITLYFKSTRVVGEENYKIVLDVDMVIKSGSSTFARTYLVTSQPDGFWSAKSFKEKQTDASQQLLHKLIIGIRQWHSRIKN